MWFNDYLFKPANFAWGADEIRVTCVVCGLNRRFNFVEAWWLDNTVIQAWAETHSAIHKETYDERERTEHGSAPTPQRVSPT